MNEIKNIHSLLFVMEGTSMEDKKKALYDSARELFANKSFKDTGVADITQKAGFSVGTFYNYYASKDKLFLEIMEQENTALMERNLLLLDMSEEPTALIKKFLKLNSEGMLQNPILKQWYSPDVFAKIEKLYAQENVLQGMQFLYKNYLDMVNEWQRVGKMRSDISPEMIMAMFEAIIRIGYHKEEIGLKYFPEIQDHLTDFVLKGLTENLESQE